MVSGRRIAIDAADLAEAWSNQQASLEEIAESFGCSIQTLRKLAKAEGLPARKRGTKVAAEPDALDGGRWVYDSARGIMVWRPDGVLAR